LSRCLCPDIQKYDVGLCGRDVPVRTGTCRMFYLKNRRKQFDAICHCKPVQKFGMPFAVTKKVNCLKPSGHYMYRTVVTMCTAQWSLYVPHSGHYMYRQWSLYVPHSGHYMYRTPTHRYGNCNQLCHQEGSQISL